MTGLGWTCPACDQPWQADGGVTCSSCGMRTDSQAYAAFLHATRMLEDLRSRQAALNERREQWEAYRAEVLAQLRDDAAAQPGPEPTPPAAPAAVASSTPVVKEPKPPKVRAARKTPSLLTAPVMLGVSGASLLIAAAVVFVALTWETFVPFGQGLLVLAVAVAVTMLALWLTRLHLPISAGAVGLVAMGFAGVSVVAFDRQSAALGAYLAPVSLIVALGAGIVLTRLGLRWVNQAAGIALVGVGLSLSIAVTQEVQRDAAWLVLAGASALSGSAIVAGLRLWRQRLTRVAIRLGVAGWLGFVTAASTVWMGIDEPFALAPLVALAPLAVAVAAAWTMPRLTAALVAGGLPLVALAAARSVDAHPWILSAVVVAATAVVVAAMRYAPARVALAAWAAMSAWLAWAAIAAVALVVHALVTLTDVVVTEPRPGPLVAAGACAALAWIISTRPMSARLARAASAVSAVMIVTGTAHGLGWTLALVGSQWATALVLLAYACALGAMVFVYRRRTDRRIVGFSALVLTLWAGVEVLGGWAAGLEPWWGLAVATATVLSVMAAVAWRWQRLLVGVPAVILATAVAPAITIGSQLSHDWWAPAASVAGAVAVTLGRLGPPGARVTWWAGAASALIIPAVWSVNTTAQNYVLSSPATMAVSWQTVIALALTAAAGVVMHSGLERGSHRAQLGMAVAVTTHLAALGGAIAFADTAQLTGAWMAWLITAAALAPVVALAAVGLSSGAWAVVRGGAVLVTSVAAIVGVHHLYVSPQLLVAVGGAVVVAGALVVLSRWAPQWALRVLALAVAADATAWTARADVPVEALAAAAAASALAVLTVSVWLPERWRTPLREGGAVAAVVPVAYAAAVAGWVVPAVVTGASADTLGHSSQTMWWLAGAGALSATSGRVAAVRYGPPWAPVAQWCGAAASLVVVILVSAAILVGFDSWVTGLGGGVLAALAAWFSARAWTVNGARELVRRGALGWSGATGAVLVVGLATGMDNQWWALGVVGAVVCLLIAAARSYPFAATVVAAALATTAGAALAVGGGAPWTLVGVVIAAGLALTWWSITALGTTARAVTVRTAVWWGAAPAAVLGALAAVSFLGRSWVRMVEHIDGGHPHEATWHDPAFAALAVIAVLSWPQVRSRWGYAAALGVVIATAGLWSAGAWILPAAASTAMVWWVKRPRIAVEAWALLAVCAFGWSWPLDLGAVTGALWVVGAVVIAVRTTGADRLVALVMAPVAALWTGLAAGAAFGWDTPLTVPISTGLALGVAAFLHGRKLDPTRVIAPWFIGISIVVMPWLAVTLTGAGTTLLVAGAASLAMVLDGIPAARWVSVGVVTLGASLVLYDAGVRLIEAYVAVPAAGLMAIGLWWMRRDPEVRSLKALGPGLALGLGASYVALITDTEALARSLILMVVALALALIGVRLRWFALVLATAVTAMVVAISQIAVGQHLAIRVVAAMVAGVVLMGMAAIYERLKELR